MNDVQSQKLTEPSAEQPLSRPEDYGQFDWRRWASFRAMTVNWLTKKTWNEALESYSLAALLKTSRSKIDLNAHVPHWFAVFYNLVPMGWLDHSFPSDDTKSSTLLFIEHCMQLQDEQQCYEAIVMLELKWLLTGKRLSPATPLPPFKHEDS